MMTLSDFSLVAIYGFLSGAAFGAMSRAITLIRAGFRSVLTVADY